MLLVFISIIFSFAFFIFSYFWIDHGLVTFLANSHPVLVNLYEVVKLANENRVILAKGYAGLTLLLFLIQLTFFIPRIYKNIKIKILLIASRATTFIYTLSFPFLSRDIFTYYFSAKMALFYHVNPYITAPINFMEKDLFVGLLHNIASPYLYGYGFLLYTILLMIVTSFNKVLTFFIFYKILNGIFFFLAGLIIYKIIKDKRIFAIWFFNPYLLIEWLINSHNDVLMAFFFIVAFYFFYRKKWISAAVNYIFSVLTKFVSIVALPVLLLKREKQVIYFKFIGLAFPILIHFQGRTVQPWYLLWSYMFLPFAGLKTFSWVVFSLIGLISAVNYYGFIESGGWGRGNIILNSFELTLLLTAVILINEYWDFIHHVVIQVKRQLGLR